MSYLLIPAVSKVENFTCIVFGGHLVYKKVLKRLSKISTFYNAMHAVF